MGLPKRILSAKGETRRPPEGASDEPETPADLLKGCERLVQVIPAVGGRDLAAHPGGSLGHHGIAEAGDEHSLVEQELAHADGVRSEERRVGKECRSRW